MGYEVYTKFYSDWLTPRLKLETHSHFAWSWVGSNAEVIAWKTRRFEDFPNTLDVGLEHFYTGKTQRFGTLIHFGADPVTTDLSAWVIWRNQGCLLKFTEQSLFAGRSLSVNQQWAIQLPLPFLKNAVF